MNKLIYSIWLQCKLDLRNKNVLIAYYVLPLVFFVVMGAVFSKIDPLSKGKLVQSMSILAISMAAFLGTPAPLVEFFSSDTKKTYKVGNIHLWVILLTTFISALVHMLIVSVIIYMTAPIIFDATRPSNALMYFTLLLLFISVCTIIGMSIGLIAKNNTTMTMISQFVFLPTMLISGIMFPTEMLPAILGKVSKILPATHSIQILTSLETMNLTLIMPLIIIGIITLIVLFVFYRKIQID